MVWLRAGGGVGNTGAVGDMNWSGLMILTGIVMGTWAAGRVARKKDVWGALPWVVIPGVIGARLYHVIDWWWYYGDHLALAPAVWTGGLGIFGGIGGGIVGLWLFCRKNKQDFLGWLDVVAVGLPLGQAIGRWGNWFNQELYGKQTNLPWGVYIEKEAGYFHPLFLYESIWNLLVFGIVWRFASWRKWAKGDLFAIYLSLYGLGRFGLEWLRLESWPVNKIVSLSLVVLSWVYIWTRHRRNLSFS